MKDHIKRQPGGYPVNLSTLTDVCASSARPFVCAGTMCAACVDNRLAPAHQAAAATPTTAAVPQPAAMAPSATAPSANKAASKPKSTGKGKGKGKGSGKPRKCSACQQSGHNAANRNCPKYEKDPTKRAAVRKATSKTKKNTAWGFKDLTDKVDDAFVTVYDIEGNGFSVVNDPILQFAALTFPLSKASSVRTAILEHKSLTHEGVTAAGGVLFMRYLLPRDGYVLSTASTTPSICCAAARCRRLYESAVAI